MFSESEPLWPYLLLAAGWSAACGYLLLRSRRSKAGGKPLRDPIARDSESSTLGAAAWEHDTQAGRM